MSMLPHIQFATLVDFVEDRLAPAESGKVQDHLSACARCAGKAARLRNVSELMLADKLEDAPQSAIARAVSLFQPRTKRGESPLRRMLAALKFDSLQMTPAFGLRAGAATERQLLFSAGENELHLQVALAGEEWQVTGQVLGPCSGGEVELHSATATIRAALNELCEFVLPPLAEGEYTLMLHLGHIELEIPDLRLGEPKA